MNSPFFKREAIILQQKVHIKIDGADAILDGKQTVLQMLNANDSSIEVPNVCYHPGLGPIETYGHFTSILIGYSLRNMALNA